MIFFTVGTQLPFERLVDYMEKWSICNPNVKIVGQICDEKKTDNFISKAFMSPDEYMECFTQASVVISHAGMGSIISAIEYEKPIIIVPRFSYLGEHRNDHQIYTAEAFSCKSGIYVANDYDELSCYLNCNELSAPANDISIESSLISYISSEID
jgi:UDP-N-acetylglucosamine transferase subunit ALG13